MENEKKVSKTRKITGIVLTSVLFAATTIGAGFAYANTAENTAGYDTSFNDMVKIQADVEFQKAGKDINDSAKSISDTLEFLGMQNATVSTVGDNRVIITNPIASYENIDSKIKNDKNDHFKTMNASNNRSYIKEVATLGIPLFFDGTLDIRNVNGTEAIIETEVSGVNKWTFNSEFEISDETGSSPSKNLEFDEVDEPQNFFEEAKLSHSNGYPVIELKIRDEGTSGDGYVNAFKEFNTFLYTNNTQEYVVWFNYDLTYSIIEAIDPDGLTTDSETNLLKYVQANPNLRPLYLTVGTGTMMSSKFSDTVEFTGDFNEQQAHYFVNKINNSNSFKYSNVNYSVVINLQTKIMLIVMATILLLMILVVMFSFVYYFGLLGLISATVFLLITMTMGLVFASTGLLVSGIGLIALSVITTFAATVTFTISKTYKENNQDKFHSTNRVASDKYKEAQSKLFIPMVVSILLFYGSGLILPVLLAIPLYLIVIGMVLAYAFGMLVLMPILFITDSIVKFTRVDYEGKWDLVIGLNTLEKRKEYSDEKGKPLVGVIVSLVALALALIIGGTLYGVTGSTVNSNVFGTQDYAYVIKPTSESAKITLGRESELGSGKTYEAGTEQLETAYDSMVEYTNEVENAFESNGVKVSKTSVVRYDEYVQEDEGQIPVGSFGYEVYSKDAINKETANEINTALSAIEIQVIPENGGLNSVSTQIKLVEGLSWNGKESMKIVSYTENTALIKTVLALLLMSLITSFIIIFISNSGVALAALITTLMESVLIISPLVILYIPFSILAMIPVLLLAGLSFRNKIVITRDAMNDEIDSNKWKRSAAKQKWTTPIISGILLFFELLLFGTYGVWVIVPMLVITICAPFSIYLIQQITFPYFAEKFSKRVIDKKNKRVSSEIEQSKNKKDGTIQEEYIEGVNI